MKKEKKFLEELDKKLVGIGNKEKQSILLKYQEMIKSRKDNKERIKDIIKSIGSVDEVAKKEIEEYKKNNSFKYKFNKLSHSVKSFVINDLYKDKEKDVKARQEKKIKQEEIIGLLDEYNGHSTRESIFCYLVDKIECLLQLKLYDLNEQIEMKNILEDANYYEKIGIYVKEKVQLPSDVWIEGDRGLFEDDPLFANLLNDIQELKKDDVNI